MKISECILSDWFAQDHLSDGGGHVCGFRVTAAQARNLEQRFARAGEHAEQIAFFSASFSDDVGPLHASGPTHRSACGRGVQLRRRLEPVLPLLRRNFETDVLEAS